jgi:DNA-binding HxlR family transcriptional regulator
VSQRDHGDLIASHVLSDRLGRLERAGLVTRAGDPDDRRRFMYELTERGRSLLRVLQALTDWGLAHVASTSTAEFERVRRESRAARKG